MHVTEHVTLLTYTCDNDHMTSSPRDVITSLLSQNKYGTVGEYQKPVKIICHTRLYNFESLSQNRTISVTSMLVTVCVVDKF